MLIRAQKDESAVGVRVGVRRVGDARQVLDPRVVGLRTSDGRVVDVTWTRVLDSRVGVAGSCFTRKRSLLLTHPSAYCDLQRPTAGRMPPVGASLLGCRPVARIIGTFTGRGKV